MVNIVEKVQRDHDQLGQATELNKSTTISIIEQAMKKEMKS